MFVDHSLSCSSVLNVSWSLCSGPVPRPGAGSLSECVRLFRVEASVQLSVNPVTFIYPRKEGQLHDGRQSVEREETMIF